MYAPEANLEGETVLSLSNRALADLEELYRFADNRLKVQPSLLNAVTATCRQVTEVGQLLYAACVEGTATAKAVDKEASQLSQFDVLTWLGTGTFGVTKLCRHRKTGVYYCMKIMSKQRVVDLKQQQHVRAERHILSLVKHPFLCTLFTSFQDDYNLFLVMDYVQGGEMFQHIRNSNAGLPQDVVRFYAAEVGPFFFLVCPPVLTPTTQIVLALEYLHSLKIAHRDLKVRWSGNFVPYLTRRCFSPKICCWTSTDTFALSTLALQRLWRTRPLPCAALPSTLRVKC